MNEKKYIDQLIANCEKAKLVEPIKTTFLKNKDELNNLPKIKQAIYVIELTVGDAKDVFEKYKKYKERGKRKCSRLNTASKTLYVGSSTTGLNRRLEQHLKFGPKGTYALHMADWFKGKVKVTIYEFDSKDIDKKVLQIIEDSKAYVLKPAFGKPGGNVQSAG